MLLLIDSLFVSIGTIPRELGNLRALNDMYLHENGLTGGSVRQRIFIRTERINVTLRGTANGILRAVSKVFVLERAALSKGKPDEGSVEGMDHSAFRLPKNIGQTAP